MTSEEYRKIPHPGDLNILRNTLVTLNSFVFVQLTWEMDVPASNATGDTCGEWIAVIDTHDGRTITKKGESIEEILMDATREADEANAEYWKRREESRNAALSKLTPEDRKALGLR